LADARRLLGRFLDNVYHTERIHLTWESLTLTEFEWLRFAIPRCPAWLIT